MILPDPNPLSSRLPDPTAARPYILDYGIPETEDGILPWSHFCLSMENSLHYWITTVDEHHRPHATPVWGVWRDNTLFFDGSPKTRRGRNLYENPAVAVHLESGSEVVILHGDAYEIHHPALELRDLLSTLYTAKYQSLCYAPGPETWVSGGLYFVQPHTAFAWTEFPKDATRWQFAAE